MPSRVLRDGILTSERVDALSERAENFYRRLMSVVDDYGRFFANPKLLRSACFPLKDPEALTLAHIDAMLGECKRAGLLVVYAAGGKEYLELQDFGQRIQSKSKYPAPTESIGGSPEVTVDHGESPKPTAVVGVVVGVVDEGVQQPRKRGRTPKTPMPADFGISERVTAWAAEKGYDRLSEHLESFRSKARKQGYAYADWDEAFMEAVREDWAKLRVPKVGAGSKKRVDL